MLKPKRRRKSPIVVMKGATLVALTLILCSHANADFRDVIQRAKEILYDNATSGMTSTNAQDAIDEIDGRIDIFELPTATPTITPTATTTPTVTPTPTATPTLNLDQIADGVTYGRTTIVDRDELHAWLTANTQSIYIDGLRTDDYTPDGSVTKPYKTIKAAVAALTGSSSVRYCLRVASAIYTEDNPITWKQYLYMVGDFKHSPRIQPLNNSYNLIEFPSGYCTSDFGELSFIAPTNGAIFYAGSGAKPIAGVHSCLLIGSGAGSVAYHCEEDGSGYHVRGGYAFGTFGTIADMDGGNYYESGFWVHEGTTIGTYLSASGAQSHAIYDLKNDSTGITTLAYLNNASGSLDINRLKSAAITTLLHQDAGSTTLNMGQMRCDARVQVDGGDVSVMGLVSEVAADIIALGTAGAVDIQNCNLYATGSGSNCVVFSAQPSTAKVMNCVMETSTGAYDMDSSVSLDARLINNTFYDGIDTDIVDSSTSDRLVPGVYATIQDGLDAASANERVLVASGTYAEQITLKYKVTVEGASAASTILQYAGHPIADLNASWPGAYVRNLTVKPTSGTVIMGAVSGLATFSDCTFEDGTALAVDMSALTGHVTVTYSGCSLSPNSTNVAPLSTTGTSASGKIVTATLDGCTVQNGESAGAISFAGVSTGTNASAINLTNGSTAGIINCGTDAGATVDDSTLYDEWAASPTALITMNTTQAPIYCRRSTLTNWNGGACISFTAEPAYGYIQDNMLESSATYDVESSVPIDSILIRYNNFAVGLDPDFTWTGMNVIGATTKVYNDLWIGNNCSALSFTDRSSYLTPGKAIEVIKNIRAKEKDNKTGWGKVDKDALPAELVVLRELPVGTGKVKIEKERNLSSTVSAILGATQSLIERVEKLEKRVEKLEKGELK
jgi:hypothetical protein